MPMKYPNDTIGNRTRNLPACSAVPQPTASPRGPLKRGAILDSEWYVRILKMLKQRIWRFRTNRMVSLGHNLHHSRFITLRLTSFWPPEGRNPRTPFCGLRRHETQPEGRPPTIQRSFTRAAYNVWSEGGKKGVLILKEALSKISLNFVKA